MYIQILGPKQNLDHRSFFSLGWNVNEFKLFPLSKEVLVNGTALCYSHQVCCLLYYLRKINSGIHMCQYTFITLHFCFRIWLWFQISTKILADRQIWRKKAWIGGFAYPYSPPPQLLFNFCPCQLKSQINLSGK